MTVDHEPIRVGIAGLGRSGWSLHARCLEKMPDMYRVAAVADPDPGRCEEARDALGCRSHARTEDLFADPDIDVVVIATPNQLHAQHALGALEAGRHVVCEKPFALSAAEADRIIAAAERVGRVVAPFQNRRYEWVFTKIREVIASGRLGRLVHVRIAVHRFSRRWDWQTLKRFGGGELNNAGAHFLDQALELFGDGEPEVFCHLDRALTSGDADDHAKVILRGPGRPLVEVEVSAACAFPQDLWLVMGTRGGLRGTRKTLECQWVDMDALPPRPVQVEPMSDRSYNSETLPWQNESWDAATHPVPATDRHFYTDLYRTLRHGEPIVITPQSVRRQIHVLERCHALSGL